MPVSDQGVSLDRYMLIPRTLVFTRREDRYLLIKGAPDKRLWGGKYNGIGGHVEPGEDLLSAARREFLEETGANARLWLCGTVVVDTGQNPGICLYVFSGEVSDITFKPTEEGKAEWVAYEDISQLPVVDDLPYLLDRIHQMKSGDAPFAARSHYDAEGNLIIKFAE